MGTMGCFLAPLEFVMIHDPSAVISPNFIGTSPACEGLRRYINLWEAFWGFKLRQPHFRQKKNLPANVLQDPASSCFSH